MRSVRRTSNFIGYCNMQRLPRRMGESMMRDLGWGVGRVEKHIIQNPTEEEIGILNKYGFFWSYGEEGNIVIKSNSEYFKNVLKAINRM